MRIELHRAGRPTDDDQADAGLAALAIAVGITHRQARRCLHTGLTDRQADRYATRIGMHPASIWPEWWEAAGDDADWYTDDPALESLRPGHRLTLIVAP
jgi:hypothetical protein